MHRVGVTCLALAGLVVAGGVASGVVATPGEAATRFPGIPAADRRAIEGFERWTRLAVPRPARLRALGSVHHAGTRRIFASPPRSKLLRNGRQRFPYPVGTVIVKTNTSDGVVDLIAIMKKVTGGTNTAASWAFIEYQRGSASERFRPIGEAACTGCHAYANGKDLDGQPGPRTDSVFSTLK